MTQATNISNHTSTVWVLIIDHRGGRAVTIHKTEYAAKQHLFQHCKGQVDGKYAKTLGDLNQDQFIEQYFKDHYWVGWEFYLLEECTIQ